MICAFCKNEIESDSYFCDQCGKEINVCPQCGQPGKGKVCTEHGKKLIPAKERNDQKAPSGQPQQTPDNNTQKIPDDQPPLVANTGYIGKDNPYGRSDTPGLTLVNNAINFKLQIVSGDIIGRKKGRFAEKFFEYKQISGGHARIDFDGKNWQITDLDSSNGTKYNGAPLAANVPQNIVNNSRIILANIEFIVQIDAPAGADDDKTIRL